MGKFYVYAHVDKETQTPFYIGIDQRKRAFDKFRNDFWKAFVSKYASNYKVKFTIIVLIAFFAQSCQNVKVENDWTRNQLQGKVMSYSEFSYEAIDRFGKIEKGKRKRNSSYENDEQRKYDEKGNLIEKIIYKLDSSLYEKLTCTYDEKGKVIEVNMYKSDGSLSYKSTYKYDEKGNQIEVNSSLGYKGTYKYDEKGNRIEDNFYESDGSLSSKSTYKYDEKGNRIEDNSENLYRDLDRKWTYKYEFDKQGNWIKRIDFRDYIPKFILEREYEYYN